MRRSLMGLLIITIFFSGGLICQAVAGNLEWLSNSSNNIKDNVGNDLIVGSLVQLIWVGPDGVVNPPSLTGDSSGDDQLVPDTTGNENPTTIGGVFGDPGVLFVKDITYPVEWSNRQVYTRVFNASTVVQATKYNDSAIYTLTGQIGEQFDVTASGSFNTDKAFSPSDSTTPTITVFSLPTTSNTLTVPISALTATDNVGITGYMVTESPNAPAAIEPGWSAFAPTSYTFTTAGAKTLYVWAKDAAGNVSVSLSASTNIQINANIGSMSGRVSVNLFGNNDLNLKNATASLQGTPYTTLTDGNGNFTLASVPFGNYTLIITAPNLDPITQNLSLTGQSLQISLPPILVEQANCLQGDANGDGRLGLADAVYILQVLTGIRQ